MFLMLLLESLTQGQHSHTGREAPGGRGWSEGARRSEARPLLDTQPVLSSQAASSFLEPGVQLGVVSRLRRGCSAEDDGTGPTREPQHPLPSGPTRPLDPSQGKREADPSGA